MKKFITNGIITKKIDINDSSPEGFHFGKLFICLFLRYK